MTALDHLRIAVTGGVLLFVILETAFTLWRARARIGEALGYDGLGYDGLGYDGDDL